jgi:tetratricopeptide (TPR) repeat protein
VHSRTWLVWSLSEVGRFDEAAARAGEARQIAEMASHPHNVIAASWATGYLNCARRTLDQAIPSLERAHFLSQEANVAVWLRPSAALLGYAHVLRGDLETALPLLEHAVAAANENKLGLAAWQTYLGAAYAVADRLDEARDLAQEALALARERNEQGFEAHALLLLAHVASRGKVVDEAELYGTQALALAEDRGMKPLAARCHVALGELYRSAGNTRYAHRHLDAGKALLQELGVDPEAF